MAKKKLKATEPSQEISADLGLKDIIKAAEDRYISNLKEIETAATSEERTEKIKTLYGKIGAFEPWERQLYESYCAATATDEIQANPEQAAALMEMVKVKSTNLTTVSHDPIIRAMTHGETGEVLQSTNPATGELAVYSIRGGALTLEEKATLIAIKDLRDAGNVTPRGFIYFSLGQLYRAKRGQKATGGIQKEQKEAELKLLEHMAETWHNYELNETMKLWGGFETKRGKVKLLGFDVHEGTINGNEDDLIVLHNTPFLITLLDRLRFHETLNQEVKEIKEYKYTLKLKKPLDINGKKVKSRSFKSNQERREFCKKYEISKEDIADHGETLAIWKQTSARIALREALTDFVFGYINARGAGRNVSNRRPYRDIFEHCGINTANRMTVKRAKEDIAVILDYWSNSELVPWLKGWREYTNKRSTKPDGIEIFLERSGTGEE